ncbi:hypothetical protein J3R30DRAFT_3305639, partial [Lentinula aciculospora]
LFYVQDNRHRTQRRILDNLSKNPAFNPGQLRGFSSTFFVEKAGELRDLWVSQIELVAENVAQVDALPWLNRMILDVIGGIDFRPSPV